MRLGVMMAGTILFLTAGPAVAWSQVTTLTPPGNPECQDYTVQAAVEGRPATVVGHACQAPDGRWQVVQGAPVQPAIVPPLTAYPPIIPPLIAYPPPSVYYPYGSWLVGPPVAFGAGSAAFFGTRQFSRFHAVHGFRRFPRFFFRFHAGVPHHFRSVGVRSFGVRSFGGRSFGMGGGGGHR
jgi:hypothetical protein